MKNLLIAAVVLFMSTTVYAQSIVGLEYFYDVDPGVGGAQYVAFTNQNLNDINFDFITTNQSLAPGTHYLYIRSKDFANNWSQTYRRRVEIVETFATPTIAKAEYFIDTDPGIGLANTLVLPQTGLDDISWNTLIPAETTPGIHYLYIRTQDTFGKWSQTYRRQFELKEVPEELNIVRGEYAVDTDPGFGQAQPFAVVLPPDNNVNWSELLSINTTEGTHFLYLRMKDSEDKWSQTFRRQFEKRSETNATIIGMEYSLNTDLGYGGGTFVSLTPTQGVTTVLNVLTSSLPLGTDTVYFRSLTTDGRWSQTVREIFNNCGNTIPVEPISLNGNGIICGAGSIALTSPTRPNCTYQWLRNGDVISGATSIVYDASTSGNYSVTVSNTLGCSITTEAIEIIVAELPDAAIVSSSNSFCPGSSLTLNAENVDEGSIYQWYLNGIALVDSTDTDITVNTAGSYALQVTDSLSCTSISQNYVVLEADAPNAIVFPSSSPINICQGESVELSTLPSATNLFQWNNVGLPIVDETTSTLIVNSAGLYSVTVSNGSCSSVSSEIQVLVNSNPATPTVILFNGQLVSSSNSGNQWFFNGQPITNATSSTLVPTGEGAYTVEVTNSSGCTSVSEPFGYFPSTIVDAEKSSFLVYPNPTINTLYISCPNEQGLGKISIYNNVGQIVWQNQRSFGTTPELLEFNLVPGLYQVEVQFERESFKSSIVVL
jgi:hypothetical protein